MSAGESHWKDRAIVYAGRDRLLLDTQKQTFQPTAKIPMAGNRWNEPKGCLYTYRLLYLHIPSRNTRPEIRPHQSERVALRVFTIKAIDNGCGRPNGSPVSYKPSDPGYSAAFRHSTARESSRQTSITDFGLFGNLHQQRWKTKDASRTMETRTDPGSRKFWYGILGWEVIDIRSCTARQECQYRTTCRSQNRAQVGDSDGKEKELQG